MTKALSWVVGVCVAGVVFCLAMTIYTGVKQRHASVRLVPQTVPTPALGR